ncbi:MAG: prolipoprotein diacylglyceryl transferase, partial [Deltaproteobacteria bacterium]|nr:prolipoprotein diacylglyceryl transferase [Deltaproteobacteria bacterium]
TEHSWGMVFPGGGPLPRHPSQLYEAFFEGLVLFVILYLLHRRKVTAGIPFFSFFIGYGLFRFLIEFVRQPDAHLGFLWGGATMGQLLSLPMVVFGLSGCLFICLRKDRP